MSQLVNGIPVLLESKIEDILPSFDDNMFDACLCDSPYGLKFMSNSWDHGVPSVEIWREIYRVLKPGAFLMSFGGTRTYHRLAVAIEDAGFEIRDCLMWLHGQGFPKSLDIGKSIDRDSGIARGYTPDTRNGPNTNALTKGDKFSGGYLIDVNSNLDNGPVTENAILFDGYGTALKPAWEPVLLAMKPCEGTFAQNAMIHSVAGINVDGCRVGIEQRFNPSARNNSGSVENIGHFGMQVENDGGREVFGRWPANFILSHHPSCLDSECHPLCPVRLLDEQVKDKMHSAGTARLGSSNPQINEYDNGRFNYSAAKRGDTGKMYRFGDSGGASRFFYTAKVSTRERNLGGIDCKHPTLKPISITSYLATLLLPPARSNSFSSPRQLLVPFSGAGSEVIGGLLAGWDMVYGIEMESEYVTWAEARVQAAIRGELESGFNPKPRPKPAQAPPSLPTVDLDSMLKRQL